MKKRIVNAFFNIIMGIALAVGPYTLFKVCDTSEKIMKCWWSVRAEMAIGGLLIFTGILILILKKTETLILANIYSISLGVAAILIPSVLIGGCSKTTMACRSLTFPSIYIIAEVVILFSIVNIVLLNKEQGSEQNVQ